MLVTHRFLGIESAHLPKLMGQPGVFAFSSLELESRAEMSVGGSLLDLCTNKSSEDDNREKRQRRQLSEHPSKAVVAHLVLEVASLFVAEISL